jgi:hypothetical protein
MFTRPIILDGARTHRFGSGPLFGRRQLHTGAARLRKTDGYGLFRGTRPVDALADVMDFFTNKFSGLGRRRFSFASIFLQPS